MLTVSRMTNGDLSSVDMYIKLIYYGKLFTLHISEISFSLTKIINYYQLFCYDTMYIV